MQNGQSRRRLAWPQTSIDGKHIASAAARCTAVMAGLSSSYMLYATSVTCEQVGPVVCTEKNRDHPGMHMSHLLERALNIESHDA